MTPTLGTVPIDLSRLLETRMLIQSNSGGGKSHALRRVLEQTASGVQQIVIDPEGEFSTLREKFDYIICAPTGGDAVATPATAAALARAVWESGLAVVDIYELKAHDRIAFVRRFLEALINAPKKVWHPTLVVIDECQIFAPQVGQAESLGAVSDLATRGRKRGLSLLAATQRLSKLHKDVAAETLNKMIGRTGLDIDVARAVDELGMTKAEGRVLRDLNPGEFFVFGPALTRAVTQTKIGPVATTHPQVGHRLASAPPPASGALLAKLAKLEGLQREAVDEVKTVETLTAEVTALRRRVTVAERAQTGVPEAEVQRRIREAVAANAQPQPMDVGRVFSMREMAQNIVLLAEIVLADDVADGKARKPIKNTPRNIPAPVRPDAVRAGPITDGVTAPQQKIIDSLASLEMFGIDAPNKTVVAVHAAVSSKSSGYSNNLGALRSKGLIDYPSGGRVALTEAGKAVANYPDQAPTLKGLHEAWLRMVTRPQAAILEPLIRAYPDPMPKAELASRAGVSAISSGFSNNLGYLRTLGAIDYPQPGHVAATALLFPKGEQ